PYAQHPEALASVREKVEATNAGTHIEPVMNAGFEDQHDHTQVAPNPSMDSSQPQRKGSTNEALLALADFGATAVAHGRESSTDEHTVSRNTRSPCDLPAHLHSATPRKVPMFAMPQQPMSDID
ncbi:hypothetical protein BAUCODRAFT_43147, partial [Baudoinia panamericana UAMH 10762]